jgi:multimeric flavodoxin WrbA
MARVFSTLWLQTAAGRRITEINAYDAGIKPCIHCGHCKTTPSCIYNDFEQIDAALRRAAILVIASPVYGLSFPAPLKAIFDRLQRYFEEKFVLGNPAPLPRHKPALFLSACGSNDRRGFAIMTEQLDLSFRLMNATRIYSVTAANTDKKNTYASAFNVQGCITFIQRGLKNGMDISIPELAKMLVHFTREVKK